MHADPTRLRQIVINLLSNASKFTSDGRIDVTARLVQDAPEELLEIAVADTARLRDKPVLIITGEHDIDHPREVDGAIADWLNDVGAKAEFQFLPDHGIGGNGHMLMLEDNSDEIAHRIIGWIKQTLDIG